MTKLNPAGSNLAYSTFLGGASGDRAMGVAVDGRGCAYVTGHTYSIDFPTTAGAFDRTPGGSDDNFLTRLNRYGTAAIYSTYLGGTGPEDLWPRVAIDGAGCAYVAGGTRSSDFPTTPGAYDTSHNGAWDAYVVKMNLYGTGLAYGTFLGATNDDTCAGAGVAGSGAAYVTGSTESPTFPTTPGAFDRTYGGVRDAFVARLAIPGSGVYFGPSALWRAAQGWTSQNLYPRFLGDVNHDHKADVVGFGQYGAYVSLSTGSLFRSATLGTAYYGRNAAAGGWTTQDLYPRWVADVNGGGKADIVGFSAAGTKVSLAQ